MAPETETRRQRLRRELTAEVIAAARLQLQSGGPAGVTWRGIARSVGVNPASLYTYFDSLDDVFTAVILDSFERLGAAMQTAAANLVSTSSDDMLIELACAFRRWAVEHPAEFNLIFTDQIPGYAAPPEGPTVQAQAAIFGPFATLLADDFGTDHGDQQDGSRPELPDDPSTFIALWAAMHGLVMLEINNHLPFIDEPEALFIASMKRAFRSAKT